MIWIKTILLFSETNLRYIRYSTTCFTILLRCLFWSWMSQCCHVFEVHHPGKKLLSSKLYIINENCLRTSRFGSSPLPYETYIDHCIFFQLMVNKKHDNILLKLHKLTTKEKCKQNILFWDICNILWTTTQTFGFRYEKFIFQDSSL